MHAPSPDDIRDVERRALERAAVSASGIGAAVAGALPALGGDERRVRVRVSDGRIFGWVDLVLADTAADPAEAVERAAGDLPQTNRLLALEERSPLHLGIARSA